LLALLDGLLDASARMADSDLDAVLQAAATAFGFVYIYPLQDGNGRLHRCLIHHVLAERKFTPPGLVFPVSSVMPYIDWCTTPSRNVEVLNDTADLYRYFDCTRAAEFLYACVLRTVEQDLPHEIDCLRRHDEAMRAIMNTVEMPDRLAENFIMRVRRLPRVRRRISPRASDRRPSSLRLRPVSSWRGGAAAPGERASARSPV
jgi:hypothetical protein